jgi:hypothetical protein
VRRAALLVLVALGVAACTRVVVLDPAPDANPGLPDAGGGTDGGFGMDAGSSFLPDAGVIGDAALAD